eukprot:CAMPEP_0185569684 /NCGR_PEP_ID=MMETSP0434-20130131/2229_1 /TAXON_ID=626734 ORGANISM="Favella taraikaensis, Strain Fe Narragansett Bay" /NCGR_SAMPLE_ID=MMETSP0434 /ASSEMBLY_ACC=CAM_ASM_000379 /LENGTH=332 /DNA_ID=CAMNT_0028184547 /DNA_START=13 /DNA_END=1011 /DNA_ORIENTATION=-
MATESPKKARVGASTLKQLEEYTQVVADTGDFEAMKEFTPQDATTNPSLLLKAAEMPKYSALFDDAIRYGKESGKSGQEQLDVTMDKLAVNFGLEILKLVPGLVSTEVDARLSFDTGANIERARRIIAMYEEAGVKRDRILIKLATTWEGIKAAEVLEEEGIHCNMTLLFSFAQAVAAAQVGATLISPFVGRILDWYKASEGVDGYPAAEDPGVLSVTRIYNYYKAHGHDTIVMGASFRNVDEILQLAGCDKLTIAPKFLDAMSKSTTPVIRQLDPSKAAAGAEEKTVFTESSFRFALNEDAMATEKLAQGIRGFSADLRKLEAIVKKAIEA